MLNLLNSSTAASTDISSIIDELAARHPDGRTLFFRGPMTYVLSPSRRGLANWTSPSQLTLHLGGGARLKAAPLAQIFVGSPLIAAEEQIFEVLPLGCEMRPNTTAGGRLTTIIVTTKVPHNFSTSVHEPTAGAGLRFRVTGAADHPTRRARNRST